MWANNMSSGIMNGLSAPSLEGFKYRLGDQWSEKLEGLPVHRERLR